ncbi:hypothetical protein, partial [Lachnoanaerobaculum gingivalis]
VYAAIKRMDILYFSFSIFYLLFSIFFMEILLFVLSISYFKAKIYYSKNTFKPIFQIVSNEYQRNAQKYT